VSLANAELPELAKLVKGNLDLLEQAITAFAEGMRDIEGLVDYDSATVYELNRALRELAQAGRALQQLSRSIEEHPESLVRGRSGDTE
jgi:paraquat-inducible protein B